MIEHKDRLINQDITWQVLVSRNPADQPEQDIQKARNIFDALAQGFPPNADLFFIQGIIDFRLGNRKEAETWMAKALSMEPQSAVVVYIYAAMHLLQGRLNAAFLLLMRAISLKPDHAEAYWLISYILLRHNNLPGALSAIDKTLLINPQNAEAQSDKGSILKKMGRLTEAAECFKKAILLKPDDYKHINNLGVVYFLQNDIDGAEKMYQQVLSKNPACPETLSNLSAIQRLKGNMDEALRNCLKALALRPDYPDGLNNLGNLLKDAGRMEEAITVYRKALQLNPDNAELHKNYAMALLAAAHFDEGWREYEWRWKSQQLRNALRPLSKPEWKGETHEGQTVLIRAEQGLGDSIQFCRYIPLIKDLGLRVILEVPPSLKRLMETLSGIDHVVTTGETIPPFDFHCPMMNLPTLFQTTPETIPAHLPYLTADAEEISAWRSRVEAAAKGCFKVGLVWAGSSRSHSPDLIATDRKRSMVPELLAPLTDVPNVQYFSLQKGRMPAPAHFQVIDWMDECQDLADTAALIMNLDLVISVDTAIAHLTGALGKPVWIMNRFNSCWRWLTGREDSPWYPGLLRLFNQKIMGDWNEVIMRIRAALEDIGNRHG